MLNNRILLRNIRIVERVLSSLKFSKNLKQNVIKSFNTENKYLYGTLLETKTQRRKSLSKDAKGHSPITEENLNKVEDTETSTSKLKSKKSKKTLGVESSLDSKISNSENLDSDSAKQEGSKKRIKPRKVESDKNRTSISIESVNTSQKVPQVLEKFVFKSTVPINETNYPLENLANVTVDSAVESVLSFRFTDSEVKNYAKFPSVSKIMEDTMPTKNRLILSRWRRNMIADLGEDGFNKHSEALKARGKEFHLAVCNAIVGKPAEDYSEVTQNALKSLAWMLEHTSHPMAVESLTAHPTLGYKGIPDCVAQFRKIPVVMDWKLSDKPKKDLKDTYEAPVQITAYIGALNHDPNYKMTVDHGLVAVAYTNGDPCDVFVLAPKHCKIYWRHWLMRFDKFMARSHLHTDHEIDEKSLQCS